MVVRFYYALRAGFYQGMFIQKGDSTLVVRDLSSKNLSSIYWAIGTTALMFYSRIGWADSGDTHRLDYTSAPSNARCDMHR